MNCLSSYRQVSVDTPGVPGRQAERGPGQAHYVRLLILLSLLHQWYVPEGVFKVII